MKNYKLMFLSSHVSVQLNYGGPCYKHYDTDSSKTLHEYCTILYHQILVLFLKKSHQKIKTNHQR